MRTREQIVGNFTPNTKITQVQKMALLKMEKAFIDLATDIEINVPFTPERTTALRSLLHAKWCCAQAITHPNTYAETVDAEEKN